MREFLAAAFAGTGLASMAVAFIVYALAISERADTADAMADIRRALHGLGDPLAACEEHIDRAHALLTGPYAPPVRYGMAQPEAEQ